MSFLLATGLALEESENALDKNGLRGTPTDSYLSQYIIICLSAEMQQSIYNIAKESEIVKKSHEPIRFFVANASERVLRAVNKNDIADFMGHFGIEIKNRFNDKLKDKDIEIFLYNEIIKARHGIAHKTSISKSFLDIKRGIDAAKMILRAAEEAFNDK